MVAATGLKAEASIAERSEGVIAVAGGGNEARLGSLLDAEISEGVEGLVSFGIAGALRPGLVPGSCVVGVAVIGEGRWYPANEAWSDRLINSIPGAARGAVVGISKPVSSVQDKAAMYDTWGAVAVDMESHIVARLAQNHSLPFAVLRVIADTASQRLPPAAVNGLKADGTPDLAAVLKSLASQPTQLPDLIRTALATRRAMSGLLRCHRLLGAGLGFGFVDLR
ncbi:MAG TPA: phosphorylase [Hyphomicrobium sp.]|nr:phosphorylase [Hyphomicrobium sp.]